MDHFSDHSVEQASLTAANFTNNDYKLTLFDFEINVLDVENVIKRASLKRDIVLSPSFWQKRFQELSNSGLSLGEFLLLLLLSLFLELVLLLLVERRDAPAEVTLYSERILGVIRVGSFLLNQTFLDFWCEIEAIQANHGLLNVEVLVVKMSDLVNATLDLAHHHVCHGHGAQSKRVAVVDVEAIDQERHELVDSALNDLIELVAVHGLVLKSDFFLVNCLNFIEELGFPTVELNTLDVVEGLVDVRHALIVLLTLLLVNLTLVASPDVTHEELTESEEHYDEAVPADVLESEVASSDEVEWALDVVWHGPNEGPNATSLTHYD